MNRNQKMKESLKEFRKDMEKLEKSEALQKVRWVLFPCNAAWGKNGPWKDATTFVSVYKLDIFSVAEIF